METNKETNKEQSEIKKRFLTLVSDEDKNTVVRNKRRIKYRTVLRFIDKVHIFLLCRLKVDSEKVNYLFKALKNKITK